MLLQVLLMDEVKSLLFLLVKDSRRFKNKLSRGVMVTWFCVSFFLRPCHQGEEEVEMCSTELLYQGILPSLPQYMVSAICGLGISKHSLHCGAVDHSMWLMIQLNARHSSYHLHFHMVYVAKCFYELILHRNNNTNLYSVSYSFVLWHILKSSCIEKTGLFISVCSVSCI